MAEFYSYEGIRNGGTFKVDATTTAAIKDNPSSFLDKVVTLTGNFTVGYGSAGAAPLGFVEQVENEVANSGTLVCSVVWNQSRENIDCAGTEAANNYLACNGTGGFAKSTTATNAKAWGVDATNNKCTAYISG